MEIVVALVAGIAAVTAAVSRTSGGLPPQSADPLVDRIDALLPQTQCRRCHYDGCRPYAAAIVRGEAAINQCPPGGDTTIHALAAVEDLHRARAHPDVHRLPERDPRRVRFDALHKTSTTLMTASVVLGLVSLFWYTRE